MPTTLAGCFVSYLVSKLIRDVCEMGSGSINTLVGVASLDFRRVADLQYLA